MERALLLAFALLLGVSSAQAQTFFPPRGTSGAADEATSVLFAALGTPADGTFYYCSDCTQAIPCAGSGSGAFAHRINGAWECTAAAGAFSSPGAGIIVDTVGDGTLANRTLTAGTGISVANGAGAAGNPTISLDTAVTLLRSQGTGDPPATCVAQQEFYFETDTNELYFCSATNTWILVNGSAASLFTARTTFGSAADAANAVDLNETAGSITFEGSTADDFETRIVAGNPAADVTMTWPVTTGTIASISFGQSWAGTQINTSGWIASGSTGYLVARAGSDVNTGIIFRGVTTLTPDGPLMESTTTSNSLRFVENGDTTYDFNNGPCGTATCDSPNFIVNSKTQSTTQYTAVRANAIQSRNAKVLTEAGAAEVVFQITTATTQSGGGEIDYKIHATDATDYAVRAGKIRFAFLNIGGTVTATLSGADQTADGSVLIGTAGETLTYAIAADVGTANVFKLTFDIDSNIAVSAAHIDYLVTYNGPGEVIPQ